MADTQRDTGSLLTLYADNTTGDISPQDLRDGIVSILGAYGGLKCTSAQAMTSTISTTDTKALFWNGALPDDGTVVIGNPTDDDIDVTIAADYEVHVHMSPSSATASESFTFTVYVNGVATDIKATPVSDGSGNVPDFAFSGIISVSGGNTVDVRVKCAGGSGRSMTVTSGAFWMKRLS